MVCRGQEVTGQEELPFFPGSGSHPTDPHFLQITFADFLVYDVLDQHRMFEPTCLDTLANLKDFVACFEVMP